MGEQQVGERFEARLLRDLRLGAPLRLVGQIDVFKPRLAVRREDLRLQRIVELALLADAAEDGLAAFVQLAQIAQALLQRAELRIVQRARRFLAIARDERHGRAAVEQFDRRAHLLLANAEFLRDAHFDGVWHVLSAPSCRTSPAPLRSGRIVMIYKGQVRLFQRPSLCRTG